MPGETRVFVALLLVLAQASALIVYSYDYTLLFSGLALYVGTVLAISLYIRKVTSRSEAPAVLALSSLSTSLGALAGFAISPKVSSALTVIGLSLVSITYVLVSIKLRGVSS